MAIYFVLSAKVAGHKIAEVDTSSPDPLLILYLDCVLFSNGDGSWNATNYVTPLWTNQPGVIALLGGYL